ncbi:hypothetical protein DL768_010547 [Monosporascus sp. mg162]|nr:hypothetical protein DL768_010547 [Monosporascus sp. mg162]
MHLRLVEKNILYGLDTDSGNVIAIQNYDLKEHAFKHGYIHYHRLGHLFSQLGIDCDRYVLWEGEDAQVPTFRKNIGTEVCELLNSFGLEKGEHYSCEASSLPTFLEKPESDRPEVLAGLVEAPGKLGIQENEHFKMEDGHLTVLKRAVLTPAEILSNLGLKEGGCFKIKDGLPMEIRETATSEAELPKSPKAPKIFEEVRALLLGGLNIPPTTIYRLVSSDEPDTPHKFMTELHETFSRSLDVVISLVTYIENCGDNLKLLTDHLAKVMHKFLTCLFDERDLIAAFGG